MDIGAVERLADAQPDLRIGEKKSTGSHKGNGFYTPNGTGQIQRVKPIGKRTEKFHTSIENDGDLDSILLQSKPKRKKGLVFKTFVLTGGRKNVTAAMKGAGYHLGDVRIGQVILFQSKVRNKTGEPLRKTFRFTASSLSDPTKTDRGKPEVIAK